MSTTSRRVLKTEVVTIDTTGTSFSLLNQLHKTRIFHVKPITCLSWMATLYFLVQRLARGESDIRRVYIIRRVFCKVPTYSRVLYCFPFITVCVSHWLQYTKTGKTVPLQVNSRLFKLLCIENNCNFWQNCTHACCTCAYSIVA